MIFAFICFLFGYVGVVRMQIRWNKRGLLTEGKFVIIQISMLGLLVLSGSLLFFSTTNEQIISVGLMVISMILGYPFFRWYYTRFIVNKL
jgi:hypothetical protein